VGLKRVEFDDVHRLGDGQSKHSPEAFYAGSLWKVGIQLYKFHLIFMVIVDTFAIVFDQ
jgi:hypothetical protein